MECDWSSDVCSSDLKVFAFGVVLLHIGLIDDGPLGEKNRNTKIEKDNQQFFHGKFELDVQT